jgi:hypothetical protein
LGESQFRRLEKKLSTLPTLWFEPSDEAAIISVFRQESKPKSKKTVVFYRCYFADKIEEGSRLLEEYTVKRPKFGNGPLVRHPLSELLKNHISAGIEVRNLV